VKLPTNAEEFFRGIWVEYCYGLSLFELKEVGFTVLCETLLC